MTRGTSRPLKVTFVCTGSSSRSQMVEGFGEMPRWKWRIRELVGGLR